MLNKNSQYRIDIDQRSLKTTTFQILLYLDFNSSYKITINQESIHVFG